MSALFLQAAASYFGLGDIQPRRSELFTDAGDTLVVFELKLSDDDMMAIADRMKAMQAEVPPVIERVYVSEDRVDEMRLRYNALNASEKSRFGSFARYVALCGGADPFAPAPVSAEDMRAGYVERTVQATDRLTGADGKPTSNAPDFGGLPG